MMLRIMSRKVVVTAYHVNITWYLLDKSILQGYSKFSVFKELNVSFNTFVLPFRIYTYLHSFLQAHKVNCT